jgi:enamine deaminase RidA (YjgF/YER057c/UK114 family)
MPEPIVPREFGPPLGLYSHGMIVPAGELVVVAGQVGVPRTKDAPSADVGEQTRQALDNVRVVLEAAGCTLREVVRFQTFLTGAQHIPGFMKAREEFFGRHYPDKVYPPNTLLVISQLVRPELFVEIEAMAVRRRRAPAARPRAATKRAPAKRGAGKRRGRR